MQVRKASINDIDAISSLYIEQFHAMSELQPYFSQEGEQSREFIKSIIEGIDSDILVCITENEISGFVLLQSKETPNFPFFVKHKFAYLMDIVITKSSRGRGQGSMLLEAAKKWATERNLEYIELDVLSNNENAIRFYKKNNFKFKRNVMYCRL